MGNAITLSPLEQTVIETPLNDLPAAGANQATAFGAKVEKFITLAKTYEITCDDDADMCAQDLSRLKEFLKQVETKRKSLTDPLNKVKEGIMNLFRPVTETGADAVELLEEKLKAWRRHVLAEQAKAEEIARQLADAAAAKARAEAEEAARQLAAENAKADTARQLALRAQADAAAATQRADPQALADAKAAADEALAVINQAEAAALLQRETVTAKAIEATFVATPVYAGSARKTKGASYVPNYQFRVTNLALVPREYLCLDEKKVGAVVKAMKQSTNIAGIEVYDAGTIRSTRT